MALSGLTGLVVDAALGLWLGSIVFFSFVVAPRAFNVLEEDDAAALVNDVFPRYYLFGIALGVVALVTAAASDASGGVAVAAAAALGVATNVYARQVLVPKIQRAEGEAFQQYHGRSVLLNGLTLVAAAAGLIGAAVL